MPLKPCPFCGGNAYRTETTNGSNLLVVGCGACGISFKAAKMFHAGRTEWTRDIESAWNKRAIPESETSAASAVRQ